MQRVNSMHTASGTSSAEGSSDMSPMDIQLARVVAHLAQSNPGALPALLSAMGSTGPSQATSASTGPTPLVPSTTVVATPGDISRATSSPAAGNDLFYTEGTLLQPPNQVRAEGLPRFDIQSAGNIRAGWAAARGRRKSNVSRGATLTAPSLVPRPLDAPQTAEKLILTRLAKDHDLPLKNQPSGGLLYVPACQIFEESAPWTEEKLEALRKLCRKREFVGYPSFSYGMTVEDVQAEVVRSLPEVDTLDITEYARWILSSEDGADLYKGPRSKVIAGRNLDRFFEDGGSMIITPIIPVFTGDTEHRKFLKAWKTALHELDGSADSDADDTSNDGLQAVLGGTAEVAASPANAQAALQRRVGGRVGLRTSMRGKATLAPLAEEAVAAVSWAEGANVGQPMTLSDTSIETDNAGSSIPLEITGPARRGRSGTPLGGLGTPITVLTASTGRRRTPRTKRARIELSPLFSTHEESMPRPTRNSARAGVVDNAAGVVA